MTRTLLASLVLASAVLWLPVIAHADDDNSYAEFDAGSAIFSGKSAQSIGSLIGAGNVTTGSGSSFSNSTGYRLIGGYQINPTWGVEASYVDLGESDFSILQPGFLNAGNPDYTGGTRVWGWGVAGTGTLPLDDHWALFARLGAIDAHVKLFYITNTNLGILTASNSSADWKATLGAGVNWSFTDDWSVHFGWDHYHKLGNSHTTGEATVNLISVGIVYAFPLAYEFGG
ncbi:MAG TPA: outer membrane beta-barrel protein [Gammaproteobacteria bacterium]|nr:outer membrane beta-barrel protein [Gammaproteobacteria bacterium]